MAPQAVRQRLRFAAVNHRNAPDYDPGVQRHHLLPRELLSRRCFGRMFDEIGEERVGFDDFRRNGLLLPTNDSAVLRFGLPLHRGPHRIYNHLVIERVGRIEQEWSAARARDAELALVSAVMRISLLQRALRRRLLDPLGKRLALNRHDPLARPLDFSELDAMADALWRACESVQPAALSLAASSRSAS